MSGWKGLSTELLAVEQPEPTASLGSTRPADPATERPRLQPASKTTATQRTQAGNSQPSRKRARGNAPRYTDTHRLVGVYLPHDLDRALRAAAESANISNSELVANALRAYLEGP